MLNRLSLSALSKARKLWVAAFSTTDLAAVAPEVSDGSLASARCRFRSYESRPAFGPTQPRGKCTTTMRRAALATYKD